MYFGEDKNKVANIASNQILEFRNIYADVLESMSNCVDVNFETGQGIQDKSPSARHSHLSMLPSSLMVRCREINHSIPSIKIK